MNPVAPLRLALLAATLCCAPLPAAFAQQEAPRVPKCPEEAEPLPADLAAWTPRTPLAAAADQAHLAGSVIRVGQAVDAAMLPTPEVEYAARPVHPGGTVSHGGIFRLIVDRPGTYRVAISSHSWIDVVVNGEAVASVTHGPGPACSGIAKMVYYSLPAGEHVLQLSAGEAATTAILVTERR